MTLGKLSKQFKGKKSYALKYNNKKMVDIFTNLRIARIHSAIAMRLGEFESLMNNKGVLLPI